MNSTDGRNPGNPRLDRYEQLVESARAATDPREVARLYLLAMLNDQLAFLHWQTQKEGFTAVVLERCMRSLEEPYVIGYLLGAATYVAQTLGEADSSLEKGSLAQQCFMELYGEGAEPMWEVFRELDDADAEFHRGADAGSNDIWHYLSKAGGNDLGASAALAEHVLARARAQ